LKKFDLKFSPQVEVSVKTNIQVKRTIKILENMSFLQEIIVVAQFCKKEAGGRVPVFQIGAIRATLSPNVGMQFEIF
jgi:hypothetical protein